jgi:hypothetical protein
MSHDSSDYKFRLDNTDDFYKELDDIEGNYNAMMETLMGWAALTILEPNARYRGDTEEDVLNRLEESVKMMIMYTKHLYVNVYSKKHQQDDDELPSANVIPFPSSDKVH